MMRFRETLHDPRECEFCANDEEQCHATLDCECQALPGGYCRHHLTVPGGFRHAYFHPGPQDCMTYIQCRDRAYGL